VKAVAALAAVEAKAVAAPAVVAEVKAAESI
jgi:hypothetical protein